MPKYTTLKAKYFQDKTPSKSDYLSFLGRRLSNELTIFTGLKMHPFDKKQADRTDEEFEIFYLPSLEIAKEKEKVFINSKLITEKINELPSLAAKQSFFNTLIFELQSTNDIEGIRSSRQELGEAVDNVIAKSHKPNMRFDGLVKQYLNLLDGADNNINEVEEFRDIWDKLVGEEEVDDQPDGELFRKSAESITDGDRVIHVGDFPESQITSDLEDLIIEMNNDDIPSLERCFIAHYYYEYIHPFYDGNGRTGRYITCSFLAKKLDVMTAVSFSSAISANKNRYYKPFTEMAQSYNKGDATVFIAKMLQILAQGQEEFISRIDYGIKQLKQAEKEIAKLDLGDEESNEAKVLYFLFQKYIFGTYAPTLADKDLEDLTELSTYRLRKVMTNLETKGLVRVVKEKPKVHALTETLLKKVNTLH